LPPPFTLSAPISFRDFMSRALYDPQHGYYAAGRACIGRKGDYITSVSVGPLFGALIARQLAEMWERLDRPNPFDLVEQGAHDGTLAADVLAALRRIAPDCVVRLHLVEPFDYWRAKQEQRQFGCETLWYRGLDELPEFTGVHFSNELADAFPVHLVHHTPDGWRERYVESHRDGFAFVDHDLSCPVLADYVAAHLAHMPVRTVTEINLDALAWIAALARKIQRGFVLMIDYGSPRAEYYAPHRFTGTLEAIGEHQREANPLARPGEVDLTAHVDFTAIAESAEAAGMHAIGFTDQHHFLVGLSRLHFPDGTPPEPRDSRAFQTLAHPTLLGRAFKVLCLAKDVPASEAKTLAGFAFAAEPRGVLGLPP
jgi:SAM-dependent MidA family methyltransferase